MFIKTLFLRDPLTETAGNGSAAPVTTQKPVTSARLTTPQMPSTPSKADLEVKFSMDDMPELEIDKTTVTVDDKKVPTEKKEEPITEKTEKKEVTPKEEEKKEEEPNGLSKHLKAPTTEKKDENNKGGEKKEVKPIKPQEKSEFDYTPYNAEEQHLLKNMSKESRAFTEKLYKENKELAKLKDTSYLQHPQAYVLNPEFQKMQEDVSYAFKEGQYWMSQLEVMKKSGGKVKMITGWDAQGNPTLGPEMEPTDTLEEQFRLAMQNCFATGQQLKGQLQNYPKQYQQRIQQDLQGINSERAKRFGWVNEPKYLDYTIPTENGEKTVKQVKSDFISLFPPYMRNNPGIEVASDLMVTMLLQKAELDEARATTSVATTKVEEAKRGEPSSNAKPQKQPQGVNGSPAVFTMDGFEP